MRIRLQPIVVFLVLAGSQALPVAAQAPAAPAEPPKPLLASAAAGFSFTSGNSDTSTLNAGYEVTYDPQTKNRVKSDGLYIHGKTDGELSADRLGLNGRDEYRIYERAFVFGQLQYLRDRFKEIDYLISPTGGIGYRLFDDAVTKWTVDAGLGGVWEKNPGTDVQTSGAFAYGEKMSHHLTQTATVTQAVSGLHKTNDFGDALYQFGAGIAAGLTTNTQLKLEVLDTFKNKVPNSTIEKNDVALVIAFVFKN